MSEMGTGRSSATPIPNILPLVPEPRHRRNALLFPQTVDLAEPSALQPFRDRPLVVLSPHFGDACLSLGNFLVRAGHGTVIDIFTQGIRLCGRDWRDQTALYDMREAENRTFCDRLGLESRDLGCEEPELRGRRPRDMGHVNDDLAQCSRSVMRILDRFSAAFGPRRRGLLFAPLGIADHANHRATTELVLRHLPELRERFDVLLYEDQPYAHTLSLRLRALYRVAARLPQGLSVRYVLATPWPEKESLVRLYSSCLPSPTQPTRFQPCAARPHVPHEAFWSIDRAVHPAMA